jgi:hypothetical protein
VPSIAKNIASVLRASERRDDILLLARDGRHRDVAAFTAHDGPAVGRGHERRDAEPGTRAERGERRARHALAAADLHDIRRLEARQRPGDRREVVDDLQGLQAELLAQLLLREVPADVDHLNGVARDRSGDGQCGARRPIALAAMIEIHAQHAGDAREVGVLEDLGYALLTFVVDQGAARRGRADVGHQVHWRTVRR